MLMPRGFFFHLLLQVSLHGDASNLTLEDVWWTREVCKELLKELGPALGLSLCLCHRGLRDVFHLWKAGFPTQLCHFQSICLCVIVGSAEQSFLSARSVEAVFWRSLTPGLRQLRCDWPVAKSHWNVLLWWWLRWFWSSCWTIAVYSSAYSLLGTISLFFFAVA